MSATLLVGKQGINELMNKFGMDPGTTLVLIESSFRKDLQYLVLNASSTLVSTATRSDKALHDYLFSEIFKIHNYVIKADGFMIMYCKSETWGRDFGEAYCKKFDVPRNKVEILLGSSKMNSKNQVTAMESMRNGTTTLLIASSVLAMGATIPGCQVHN